MKHFIVLFVAVFAGVILGKIIFTNRAAAPLPMPVAESAPAQPAPPEKFSPPQLEPLPPVSAGAAEPAKISAATPVVSAASPDDAANPIRKAVDALLSAKSGGEKHEMFEQFRKAGQMDQVIAELKRRAQGDPKKPEIPTTLGEAQLNKVRSLHEADGDVNEMGILAMQADQNFNAALKMDPSNWEAQFVKYSTMFYWPADENRDNDVVQRLSGLIDQQETMTPNPAFVQTYVVLGNQYEKMGQHNKAVATWQLGEQKFPNDPELLKKIGGL
jgi:tetratricopeptide (TPR) repeat protein